MPHALANKLFIYLDEEPGIIRTGIKGQYHDVRLLPPRHQATTRKSHLYKTIYIEMICHGSDRQTINMLSICRP